jgi:hypothetical protein
MVKVKKTVDNGMIKNRLVIMIQSRPKKIQGIKIIIPARNKPKRTSVIIYPPGH